MGRWQLLRQRDLGRLRVSHVSHSHLLVVTHSHHNFDHLHTFNLNDHDYHDYPHNNHRHIDLHHSNIHFYDHDSIEHIVNEHLFNRGCYLSEFVDDQQRRRHP